ncbi:MaoC/PaaZ C-terminal domain-containing protein [Nocardia sp. NPDC051570]|uniref:MaoC/PaaZ C-terminal domain-containing protein n=1 Tax=Nocardia sp. NPDC051570 TaxID=3364324 RepID=UPI003789CE3F
MDIVTPTPYVETTTTVDAERVRAYAAATLQDELAVDRNGGVPPLFAIGALAGPAMEELRGRHLDASVQALIHITQTVRIGAAPRTGETLDIRARIAEVFDIGPAPALMLEVHAGPTVGTATVLLPEQPRVQRGSPRLTRPERGEAIGEREIELPDELPARYADASGDHNPIHLDPEFARSVGLPGVVLHGMATYAIVWAAAERVLAEAGGPDADQRFVGSRVRFARPVVPGAALRVRVHRTSDPAQLTVSVEQHGRQVLRDTYFTLDRPGD